jgi:hypothetical protein
MVFEPPRSQGAGWVSGPDDAHSVEGVKARSDAQMSYPRADERTNLKSKIGNRQFGETLFLILTPIQPMIRIGPIKPNAGTLHCPAGKL